MPFLVDEHVHFDTLNATELECGGETIFTVCSPRETVKHTGRPGRDFPYQPIRALHPNARWRRAVTREGSHIP